jgi:hypothetical protein
MIKTRQCLTIYVTGAFPSESTNSAGWLPPRAYMSVLTMNVRGRRHHKQTYKQSWISTTTTTTPLGNAPETYHRCFANVNGPQYYYCSSQIQPDDIDSCGLYCLYYFKRRHRGTRTQFYDLTVNIVYCHAL